MIFSGNKIFIMKRLGILVVFLFFVNHYEVLAGDIEDKLRSNYPAYAIASESSILGMSNSCGKQLDIFKDAIDNKKLWSLKMLDSSGQAKPGFVYGNNFWLGLKTQCSDLDNRKPHDVSPENKKNNSIYRNPDEEYPPFKVNYFAAHFHHNSTRQYHVGAPNDEIIVLGLCLPNTCTVLELSTILNKIFNDRTLIVNHLYDADYQLLDVKDLKENYHYLYNVQNITIMIIFTLTVIIMIVGTIYDVTVHQKILKRKKASIKNNEMEIDSESGEQKLSKYGQLLVCFSIYTNSRKIFSSKVGEDSIRAVHGLRFISIFWVVLIHTELYTMDYIDNFTWSFRISQDITAQIFANGTHTVDTFFFLSGFLFAYVFYQLERKKKEHGKPQTKFSLSLLISAMLKRFVRISPAYFMTMGLLPIIYGHFDKTSQFHMSERPQDTCSKYLWRNILYINNLFSRSEMCASWSWYLSNDMQFYLIGTILIVCSSTYFYTCAMILVALMIMTVVTSGYVSYMINYTPTLDLQWLTLDYLYTPPWMRIGPYLIGIATAYLLVKMKCKFQAKKSTIWILWIVAAVATLGTLISLYDRDVSVVYTAFHTGLSRSIWATGIALIVILCATGHGGFFNSSMSWKGWLPLSRLAYCVYLLNPMIIHVVYLAADSSMHVDLVPNVFMFLGFLIIIFLASFVLSLMFEVPYIALIKVFTAQPRQK